MLLGVYFLPPYAVFVFSSYVYSLDVVNACALLITLEAFQLHGYCKESAGRAQCIIDECCSYNVLSVRGHSFSTHAQISGFHIHLVRKNHDVAVSAIQFSYAKRLTTLLSMRMYITTWMAPKRSWQNSCSYSSWRNTFSRILYISCFTQETNLHVLQQFRLRISTSLCSSRLIRQVHVCVCCDLLAKALVVGVDSGPCASCPARREIVFLIQPRCSAWGRITFAAIILQTFFDGTEPLSAVCVWVRKQPSLESRFDVM